MLLAAESRIRATPVMNSMKERGKSRILQALLQVYAPVGYDSPFLSLVGRLYPKRAIIA